MEMEEREREAGREGGRIPRVHRHGEDSLGDRVSYI